MGSQWNSTSLDEKSLKMIFFRPLKISSLKVESSCISLLRRGPKCLVTSKIIQGSMIETENVCLVKIPHMRPTEYKRTRLSRNRRTVSHAYGGVLSGGAVRERGKSLPIYFHELEKTFSTDALD